LEVLDMTITALYNLADDDFEETVQMLKELFVRYLRIYSELLSGCQDAVPAVKQRVHEIIAHMSGLEYVAKFAIRFVLNYKEFQEQIGEALGSCYYAKDEKTAKQCETK
jgi:septation ring formation regulator EzrA